MNEKTHVEAVEESCSGCAWFRVRLRGSVPSETCPKCGKPLKRFRARVEMFSTSFKKGTKGKL